jgi:predicted GIY-YIG superfamily endonuclease
VTDGSQPLHVIYRFRDKRGHLLYIGQSNDPLRRAGEHRRGKEWIESVGLMEWDWVPADQVDELERRAIESERPRYNVQHNRGHLKVEAEVSVELRPPTANDIAAMIVIGAVVVLTARWGIDAVANWNVKRRAARAGMTVDLPPVENPFADGGPDWLKALIALTATPPANLRPIVLPTPDGAPIDPDHGSPAPLEPAGP